MKLFAEFADAALDELKKGGDTARAQVYATLAVGKALGDAAERVGKAIDDLPATDDLETAVRQIAMELGNLPEAIRDHGGEVASLGSEAHPLHVELVQ